MPPEIPVHLPQARLVQARLIQAHLFQAHLVQVHLLVRLVQVHLVQVRLQIRPQCLSLHVTRENPRRQWRPALTFLIHTAVIQHLVRSQTRMMIRSYHRLRLAHLKSQKGKKLRSKRQRRRRVSRRQNLRRLFLRSYSLCSFSALGALNSQCSLSVSTLTFNHGRSLDFYQPFSDPTHDLHYRFLVLTATKFVSASRLL